CQMARTALPMHPPFIFKAPPTTALYTLSLHDALPIFALPPENWVTAGTSAGSPSIRDIHSTRASTANASSSLTAIRSSTGNGIYRGGYRGPIMSSPFDIADRLTEAYADLDPLEATITGIAGRE